MPPPLPVATVSPLFRYTLHRPFDRSSSYLLNTVGKTLQVGRFDTRVDVAEVRRDLLRLSLASTREIPAQVMELYGLKLA